MYYAAQDLMEYLMNSTGGGAQDSEHRLLRAAIHHAYRDVANAKDWLWYITESALPTPEANSGNKIYTLPAAVSNVDSLVPPDPATVTSYITPSEWRRYESQNLGSGEPIYWTVMKSTSRPDCWQLMIAGTPLPPPNGRQYYITYRRRPNPLRYMGYESVCRNNSLTSTTAPGAVKRYGTSSTYPEGLAGVYPYTAQEILGVTGSLVGTPPDGAKTVVSDLLDVSNNMYTALLSGAEMWAARMQGKNVEGAAGVFQRDLRLAMEQDVLAPIAGRRLAVNRYPEQSVAAYAGSPRALGYYNQSAQDTGT
jgi:hypothetical protein